ncbi:MAG: hypothetical protein KAT70_07635, partial [Thermoplasmata archaeon]|nr:hypothetical protein [Thermoplasmata archaeon]
MSDKVIITDEDIASEGDTIAQDPMAEDATTQDAGAEDTMAQDPTPENTPGTATDSPVSAKKGALKKGLLKKLGAVALVLLLIATTLVLYKPAPPEKIIVADVNVPEDYIIFMDEPTTEEEMMLAACASMLAVRDVYHPLFIFENGDLNWHQKCTLENMTINGNPIIYFTFDVEKGMPPVAAGFGNATTIPLTKEAFMGLQGFDGSITVSSYEEALWAASVAHVQGKKLVPGPSTFSSQEDAWIALEEMDIPPNYVIVTNPEDYRGSDVFYTEGLKYTDYDTGETLAVPEPYNASFHIPSLSLMSIQLSCAHDAWVITQAEPSSDMLGDIEAEDNAQAIGYYLVLEELYKDKGPIEYVCLVGSAEAVPQFELMMAGEGDGRVSCDVIYGFLSGDEYYMD